MSGTRAWVPIGWSLPFASLRWLHLRHLPLRRASIGSGGHVGDCKAGPDCWLLPPGLLVLAFVMLLLVGILVFLLFIAVEVVSARRRPVALGAGVRHPSLSLV